MNTAIKQGSTVASGIRAGWLVCMLLLVAFPAWGQPPASAKAAFDNYARTVEARLAAQHRSAAFLAPADDAALRRGETDIQQVDAPDIPGAMLHHWRATAFLPGVTAAQFEHLIRGYPDYPRLFAPQIVSARVLAQHGDHYQVQMRVRQRHVITVVMDTAYDIVYTHAAPDRGYTASHSTRIDEIADAGTPDERVLGPGEEHGFLWRQNTYWTWQPSPGGLTVQVESLTLTRGIPQALAWAITPFLESVPRDSIDFTMGRIRDGLKAHTGQ